MSFLNDGIKLESQEPTTELLTYNFESCPDLVPAVLTSCAALGVNASIRGVAHLQFKESDRMAALSSELAKIGASIVKEKDGFVLKAGAKDAAPDLNFDTYKDHRMAMCFAPLVFKFGEISINDPAVVEKSYPNFWNDIQQTGCVSVDKF